MQTLPKSQKALKLSISLETIRGLSKVEQARKLGAKDLSLLATYNPDVFYRLVGYTPQLNREHKAMVRNRRKIRKPSALLKLALKLTFGSSLQTVTFLQGHNGSKVFGRTLRIQAALHNLALGGAASSEEAKLTYEVISAEFAKSPSYREKLAEIETCAHAHCLKHCATLDLPKSFKPQHEKTTFAVRTYKEFWEHFIQDLEAIGQ